MKENVVFDSAKKAGTFVGKTIVCFAAGMMLVADTATRKRNFTTGNVNPVNPNAGEKVTPAYTANGKSRFVCRQCGAPVKVRSFRVAHGHVPGKGYLCDACYAQVKAARDEDDD